MCIHFFPENVDTHFVSPKLCIAEFEMIRNIKNNLCNTLVYLIFYEWCAKVGLP